MEDLDKWCNFGFRFVEAMDPKSGEYLPALKRLKVLCDRRVAGLRFSGVS